MLITLYLCVERHDCDYQDYLDRQMQLRDARDDAVQAAETLAALKALQTELQTQSDANAIHNNFENSLDAEVLSRLDILSLFDESTRPVDIFNLADRLYDLVESVEQPTPLTAKISSVYEVRTKKISKDVSLKEKITDRHVTGDKYKVSHAKEVLVQFGDEELKKKKKNFGGSGVTCGNLYKGVKNAKRFKDSI